MFCISYSLISWKKLQSWFFRSIICCVERGPHVVMVCFWRHFKNEGNVPHAVALRGGDGYIVQPFLNISSSFSLNTELRGKWVRSMVFRKQIKDCGASLLPTVVAWRRLVSGALERSFSIFLEENPALSQRSVGASQLIFCEWPIEGRGVVS